MHVINCGLPAIQGRNARDQLWVTGDTGEERMWSAVGYRRYRGGMNVIRCLLRWYWEGMKVISYRLPTTQGRNECDQLWVTGDTGEE